MLQHPSFDLNHALKPPYPFKRANLTAGSLSHDIRIKILSLQLHQILLCALSSFTWFVRKFVMSTHSLAIKILVIIKIEASMFKITVIMP